MLIINWVVNDCNHTCYWLIIIWPSYFLQLKFYVGSKAGSFVTVPMALGNINVTLVTPVWPMRFVQCIELVSMRVGRSISPDKCDFHPYAWIF